MFGIRIRSCVRNLARVLPLKTKTFEPSAHPCIPCRRSSRYVEGARHLQRLKDDAGYCREAWSGGLFAMFYDLRPLLVPTADTGGKHGLGLMWKNAQELLEGQVNLNESIVLSCSQNSPVSSPKFAISIPPISSQDGHKETIENRYGGTAVNGRKALFIVAREDARILSQSLALLQWHLRSGFCSGCGKRTIKDPSGSKRTCLDCDTIHYPTLSPVSIVLVTRGDKCLVVRQRQFPQGMYSALAGFCEAGESIEETVRREVAEEVGLEVGEVTYISSQHWFYPKSTLMLGCYAAVKTGTTDQVSLDLAELEDSRWLDRSEVQAILAGASPQDGSTLWLPPSMAIAHYLLKGWAEGN